VQDSQVTLSRPIKWSRPGLRATVACVAVLVLAACGSITPTAQSPTGHTRAFTDTAGRVVNVPTKINRVATVGYATTLDSLLYVVGAQDLLVDGIPSAGSTTFLLPYKDLAPRLLQLPKVESTINGPLDPEALLALKPDVVITSDPAKADQIQRLGIPAVDIFNLGTGSAIEHDVDLVGQLLGRRSAAAAYTTYFNNIIHQAQQSAAAIPTNSRPSALYADFGPLTQPTVVEGWIFGVLHVHNVVPGVVPNHFEFADEQVYAWNPDYIVVQMPSDLPQVTGQVRKIESRGVR